jgi:hypothetical protein
MVFPLFTLALSLRLAAGEVPQEVLQENNTTLWGVCQIVCVTGIAQQFGAIHKTENSEFFEGTPLVLPGESLRILASSIAGCYAVRLVIKWPEIARSSRE